MDGLYVMIRGSSKIPLASACNVVKCYLVEFEKDKFPGPDPRALLLLFHHFRSHPLPNYFVFGFYRFSSRAFSFRRSFCYCLFWNCLHSAMLHCTMGFILLVKSNEWSIINAPFWLVELLVGYMLYPISPLVAKSAHHICNVLVVKKGLKSTALTCERCLVSIFFWPTSFILLKQLFLEPSWPLSQ